MANLEHPSEAKQSPDVSQTLRVAAMVFADIIHCAVAGADTAHQRAQSETIWTAYDTPADLVRLIWASASALGLVYQLFQVPHDASSSRTWFYLGLVAVPFTLITLFAVW